MALRTFIITIENGKPKFTSEHARALFQQFLGQFEGKKIGLKVEPRIPKRSERQNAYYWLYLGVIARETGYTPNELHNLFKGKFLNSGITEIFGEKVRKTKSTTALNKSEFVEYITQIEDFTEIPSPDTTPYQLAE